MRSRPPGPGRPLGDTKVSGRRVTRKAPLAHVEGGSGRSEASPTAILQDTHSVEGKFSEVGRTGALRCGSLALLFVAGQDGYKILSYNRGKDSRMGRDSTKDKNEGALDKAKGRAKEAAGSLTGNKGPKGRGTGRSG